MTLRPADLSQDAVSETVKTHLNRLLVKMNARDRTQAVIGAYESGFVTPASN